MDLGRFYNLTRTIEAQEKNKAQAEKILKQTYAELVPECPHSEAVLHYFSSTRQKYQVCKICGLEDSCGYNSTPGDEYNYGYAGYPHPDVWKDSNVEVTTDEKYFWTFRKQHGWQVNGGKVVNRYGDL